MTPENLETQIRDTARELAGLYEALEERKYTAEKPPEVRTMQNTGGKPSMPGNWLWMNRGIENEKEIREWAFAAFRDLQIKLKDDEARIQPLLEKISLNAFYIAEWWQATDFHNILEHQARQMGKWLNPPEADEVANRPEPHQLSEVILQKLNRMGHIISPITLRTWASKGLISSKLRGHRATYLMSEVLKQVEKE